VSGLRGYTTPRTPSGGAGLVPPPPWHYVGDFLVVDFHADPDAAASLLPPGLEPHEDAGRCAAVFADWQSFSQDGDELLDPVRSQYKEFYLVVNAMLDGAPVTYCTFIWVDQDFAMARGWIQGFPKKLGQVWMTRTYNLDVPAAVGIGAGARFGATCHARGRQVARARVALEGVSETGSLHTDPPIVNVRHFPRLGQGHHDDPAVHELVRSVSRDRAVSPVWEGTAELELTAAPGEEHTLLSPVGVGRGYRFTFGYTVDDLDTMKEIAEASPGGSASEQELAEGLAPAATDNQEERR
jgi:acetoacetate decarboxylase